MASEVCFYVPDLADNRVPRSLSGADMESLADGILARELALCQRLAEKGSIWRRRGISLVEETAAAQRNAHSLAVLRADRIAKHVAAALRRIIFKFRTVQHAHHRPDR